MIAEIAAIGLLGYILLWALEQFMSEEKFDKLVYHSKATRIIAQIINIIGSLTIVIGLSLFISIAILALMKSGLYTKIILEQGWDKIPAFLFLTAIGAFTMAVLPFGIFHFLPDYGDKPLSERRKGDNE